MYILGRCKSKERLITSKNAYRLTQQDVPPSGIFQSRGWDESTVVGFDRWRHHTRWELGLRCRWHAARVKCCLDHDWFPPSVTSSWRLKTSVFPAARAWTGGRRVSGPRTAHKWTWRPLSKQTPLNYMPPNTMLQLYSCNHNVFPLTIFHIALKVTVAKRK